MTFPVIIFTICSFAGDHRGTQMVAGEDNNFDFCVIYGGCLDPNRSVHVQTPRDIF